MSPDATPTKEGALAVLLRLRGRIVQQISDETAKGLFTEQLVKDVFLDAWRYPFDDDRGRFASELKSIVGDAIESASLGEEKK
jgi:hypothetical protein